MKEKKIPAPVFAPLLRIAKAVGEPFDTTRLLTRQLAVQEKLPTAQVLVSIGELLDEMDANNMSLKKVLEGAGEKDARRRLADWRAAELAPGHECVAADPACRVQWQVCDPAAACASMAS